MRWMRIIVTGMALAGGLWIGSEARAGTRGGLYDFRYFLGQGRAVAETRAPAAQPTLAPTPPSARQPSLSAPRTAEAGRVRPATQEVPLGDATDGWRDRLYVGIGVLGIFTEDYDGSVAGSGFDVSFDPGYGIDLALGTYFTAAFRGEVAFTYRTSGADKASIGASAANKPDLSTWSLMLNGYYDFLRDWPVHPYLGGGVGVDYISSDSFSAGGLTVAGKDDVELGVQLIGGLAWPITQRLALTLDYRYHASTDDDIFYHSLQGGMRYGF